MNLQKWMQKHFEVELQKYSFSTEKVSCGTKGTKTTIYIWFIVYLGMALRLQMFQHIQKAFFFFLILLGLVPAEQVPSQEEEGNISF